MSKVNLFWWSIITYHAIYAEKAQDEQSKEFDREAERLPGWKGESFRPAEIFVPGDTHVWEARALSTPAPDSSEPWIETISWSPRAFVYHNFMTPEECDHIVAVAKPQMRRSTVVGDKGKSVTDNIRTSYGTFIRRKSDPVLHRIEQRVAVWTHLDIAHQEDLQVLRYAHGQKYGAHYDSVREQDGSPRIATVLLYLTDKCEGGETAFPQGSKWVHPELEQKYGAEFSECAKGHVAIKPKKGTAMLFYSLQPDLESDSAALHTGCPVIDGIKWTATIWIHTRPFRPEGLDQVETAVLSPHLPEDCEDMNSLCSSWAKSGECEKNPNFMKGDSFALGSCRLSCDECTVCGPGDKACMAGNRERAGFLALDDL